MDCDKTVIHFCYEFGNEIKRNWRRQSPSTPIQLKVPTDLSIALCSQSDHLDN